MSTLPKTPTYEWIHNEWTGFSNTHMHIFTLKALTSTSQCTLSRVKALRNIDWDQSNGMHKRNRNFIQCGVNLKTPEIVQCFQSTDFRYLLSPLQLFHCKCKEAGNNIYLHHQPSNMVICHWMITKKEKCQLHLNDKDRKISRRMRYGNKENTLCLCRLVRLKHCFPRTQVTNHKIWD